MKHTFAGLALAVAMASVSILPQPASAYRKVWLDRQQQNQSVQVTSISPSDADAQEFLALLGVTLQATDAVWQDEAFVGMILKYKEIKAESLAIVSDVGDIVIDAFDLADFLSQIDHETFDPFAMTPDERQELQAMRSELEAKLMEFQNNPEEFLSQFLGEFPDSGFDFSDFEDEYYYDEGLSAYGYPEPYEPAQEGRIVWLIDASYNPTGMDWTTEWTQTDGPEVLWLDTDSAHDSAFIVPSLEGFDGDYLTFELFVSDDEGNESTSYVYVDLERGDSDAVSRMHEEVLGYEISEADWIYWNEKYEQGMSLEEIRKHFDLFAEYGW